MNKQDFWEWIPKKYWKTFAIDIDFTKNIDIAYDNYIKYKQ